MRRHSFVDIVTCYNSYQSVIAIVAGYVLAADRPDILGLESRALEQGGYFDRGDARAFGLSDHVLQHHVRAGRFERVLPGVYRVRAAPLSPDNEYFLAWVWTNYRGAISHESALALYRLADVQPSRVHVTVPRQFHRVTSPFVVLHLAPLPEGELRHYRGVNATTPARSIVDAAASGADPEQIHRAVKEAMDRGLVDEATLRGAANRRPNQHRRDVRTLIEEALTDASTPTR